MASDTIKFTYDAPELRNIVKALDAMGEQAIAESKKQSGALVEYLRGKIIDKSSQTNNQADDRIAEGSTVSRTKRSAVGELSIGFAKQKFSGGGTTQQLWGGYEFGSNKFKQFPGWSGKFGRGSRGWFIYPTLRENQPYIIDQWETAFDRIVKEWS
jgi:hypothetical protein